MPLLRRLSAMSRTIAAMKESFVPIRRVNPLRGTAITLTDSENLLCSLLNEFSAHLKASDNQDVVCRIAGGWVRDKLLGTESHDIDIALSSMMGATFAEQFIPFIRSKGIRSGNVHVIRKNPEQSKHLETARAALLGAEIDFVNLRSEEYSGDSRIPLSVEFGSPKADAERRDINFNALFYNVHSGEVEDHTNKGLQDLSDGLVRTPLPSKQTFLDDPLRVFRCVRFASRFGFRLDEEIIQAAKDPEIQASISQKISRDRIGEELSKILVGPDPLTAIMLLHSCSLINSIFTPHSNIPFPVPASYDKGVEAAIVLNSLVGNPNAPPISTPPHAVLTRIFQNDVGTRARLHLAALLSPLSFSTYIEKNRQLQAAEYVLRHSLKLGSQHHLLDGIPRLFEGRTRLRDINFNKLTDPSPRVAIGLLLRSPALHDPHKGLDWSTSLLYSLVQDMVANDDIDEGRVPEYNEFVDKILSLQLEQEVDKKPLLTGKEICKLLQIKPGPAVGQILSKSMEWQLDHPGSDKEEISRWLQEEMEAGRIEIKPKGEKGEDREAKRPKTQEEGA